MNAVFATRPSPSATIAAGAILVMVLWALCFPLIATGLASSPPMSFATLRAAIAGLALLAIAELAGRPAVSGGSVWSGLVLVGLTATSLGFVGMFYGGARVSPGLATVIANTQPLIAAGLAWAFLDEALSMIQRLGLAAGFGGIVLIGAPGLSGSPSQLSGVALILAAALGIAISNVFLKRLAGRVDPLRAMGWQLLIGSVPLGVLALAVESPAEIAWSWSFVANLLVLSLAGTAAAFWLWFVLLRQAALSRLNVYTFLTPIFGLLIGQVFFDEQIHALALAGIVLSVLGIAAVNRPSHGGRPVPGGKPLRGGRSLKDGECATIKAAAHMERAP